MMNNLASKYQRRFYIEWLFDKESPKYNEALVYDISDHVNISWLSSLLFYSIQDSPGLLAYFTEDEAQATPTHELNTKTILNLVELNSSDDLSTLTQELIDKPFNLNSPFLFRFTLIKLANKKFRLVLCFHHIVFDGNSIELFKEKLTRYSDKINLPDKASDVITAKHLLIQKVLIEKGITEKYATTFSEYCNGITPEYTHPFLTGDRNNKSLFKDFELNENQSSSLLKSIIESDESKFTVISCAFLTSLSLHTNQRLMISTYPKNMRQQAEDITCAVNNLPHALEFDHKDTLKTVIDKAATIRKKMDTFSEIPFEEFIAELKLKNTAARLNHIFDVSVTSANLNISPVSLKEVTLYPIKQAKSTYPFAIGLEYQHINGKFYFRIWYKRNSHANFITSLQKTFLDFIKLYQENKETKIRSFVLCDPVTLPKYSNTENLINSFNSAYKDMPDKVIISDERQQFTFREAWSISNNIALNIRALCGQPAANNRYIAFCLERTAFIPIIIIGILKSGFAYLPLSYEWPTNHIDTIIDDSGASMLITDAVMLKKLSRISTKLVDYKALLETNYDSQLFLDDFPSGPAYAIYTSGTTGRPKGVKINFQNIVYMVRATNKSLKVGENELATGVNTKKQLWKAAVIHTKERNVSYVVLVFHHAIVGGITLINFLDELCQSYQHDDTKNTQATTFTTIPAPLEKAINFNKLDSIRQPTAKVKQSPSPSKFDYVGSAPMNERVSKNIFLKVNKSATTKVADSARSHGVRLNAVLNALLLVAITKTFESAVNIPLLTPIDLSTHCQFLSTDDNFGFYVGCIPTMHDMHSYQGDIIWLANRYKESMEDESPRFLQSLKTFDYENQILDNDVSTRDHFPLGFCISYKRQNMPKKTLISEVYTSSSRVAGDIAINVSINKINQELFLCFSYAHPIMPTKTVLEFADQYLKELKQFSGL